MANQIAQSPAVKTRHPSSTETTQDTPPNEVLEAVRGFLAAFSKAAKNYSLYPATHIISENLLSGLLNSLTNYFQLCPQLKLTVDKDRISYKEIEVYLSNGREDFLVTPFFRDGIIWIEFRKGVTAPELSFLVDMLSEYRTLSDESEGDLVTALWQKNLPHIHYEAADVFWDTQPRLDFAHFDVSDSSKEKPQGPSGLRHGSADGKQQSGSTDAKDQSTLSIISEDVKRSLIPLTPGENEQLQKLIKEEEHRNRRSEDPLLEYLGQKVFNISTNDHILDCYEALGKCGSTRSIPLLKAILEEPSWWEIFNIGGSPHRRGAALALAELKIPEADEILMHATRSFFPPIKRAARLAISGRRSE